MRVFSGIAFSAVVGLAACAETSSVTSDVGADYLGVETQKLDETLVNLRVRMANLSDEQQLQSYADCAAAQYALIRGKKFARLVRTSISVNSGAWINDTVYTVSEDFPAGATKIDAEVTVPSCLERGIPTV